MVFPQEFGAVCRYVMRDGQAQELTILDPELWRQSGVVYARLYADRIVYIGSTDRSVCQRIREHVRLVSSSPRNARYREWAEGKPIEILAYKPPPVLLLGREVNVHRAIEADLIASFGRPGEPDWFVSRG
jgi:hypothetical protein